MKRFQICKIIIIIFTFTQPLFSQTFETFDTLKTGSIFQENTKRLQAPDTIRFHQSLYFLRLALKRNHAVNYFRESSFDSLTTEDYSEFCQSFSKGLQALYKNHTKYDLGEISRYLGISKKIAAIILAILSL